MFYSLMIVTPLYYGVSSKRDYSMKFVPEIQRFHLVMIFILNSNCFTNNQVMQYALDHTIVLMY